jgi:hypothetical protein
MLTWGLLIRIASASPKRTTMCHAVLFHAVVSVSPQQEALELGASVLLMDEDTCATNFMMRDARMAALVAADREPITPFSSKIA